MSLNLELATRHVAACRHLAILGVVALLDVVPPSAPTATLSYTFTLGRDSVGTPIVDVSATFMGDTGTIVHLIHPTNWAGEQNLERAIVRFGVAAPAKLVGDSDGAYVVERPRNAPVSVHYVLKQDWTGPLRYPEYHRAIISNAYTVFNAQNGLIFPDRHSDGTLPIETTWRNVPSHWIVTTSFGRGVHQTANVTAPQLVDASFAAGEFRSAESKGLSVALGGSWRFADSTFARIIQRVYDTERSFWRDPSRRPYFVVLLPMDRRGSISGTAFTHGFVSIADTTSRAEVVALNVAHELFHEWNGHELRTPNPEGPDKWFSEGFTDYYADRMAHTSGLLSDSGYVDRVNNAVRRYYMSTMRGTDRATIARAYWERSDANDYPYVQGYTFGLYLHRVLTNAGSSLDEVMRTVHRAATSRNKYFSDSLFIASAPARVRARIKSAIDSMITRGADVPVLPKSVASCDSIETTQVALYDLGFDGSSLSRERPEVGGVREGGLAAKAGLKNGATLRGWSWNNGISTSPVRLTLMDGTAITYLPANEKTVAVPRMTRCRS